MSSEKDKIESSVASDGSPSMVSLIVIEGFVLGSVSVADGGRPRIADVVLFNKALTAGFVTCS
jgi:hypothetical protein